MAPIHVYLFIFFQILLLSLYLQTTVNLFYSSILPIVTRILHKLRNLLTLIKFYHETLLTLALL